MNKLKIKTQNVHYDESADAMYIRLRSGTEARIEEIEPNIIVEYDNHNNPIGIEILSFSSSVLSLQSCLKSDAVLTDDKLKQAREKFSSSWPGKQT